MRYPKAINVDERIEKIVYRRKKESIKEIYHGVGLWGRRAIKHLYFETDTLIARFALEELGLEGMNKYGKMIDRLADELQETIEKKLLATPQYALNDDYMHNVQTHNAVREIAEEEIWSQLIRVDYLIKE